MSAKILDGKIVAQKIKDGLRAERKQIAERTGKVPCMVNLMVGSDDGSCAYANSQKRVAEYIGIDYRLETLPVTVSEKDLCGRIQALNKDANVHGIMIHKPLPSQINYGVVANQVDIRKDLEGINVANIGRLILGETQIIPCTPAAVMAHLHAVGIPLRGKEAVIVGHSHIVGKPLSLLLLNELATVTICHIATSEAGKLVEHVGRADILVVAVGRPNVVKGSWIKKGAVVIDVGINCVGSTIVGDVEFEPAVKRAGYITPVPGGVGPVTVVMLMKNGIEAFKMQIGA